MSTRPKSAHQGFLSVRLSHHIFIWVALHTCVLYMFVLYMFFTYYTCSDTFSRCHWHQLRWSRCGGPKTNVPRGFIGLSSQFSYRHFFQEVRKGATELKIITRWPPAFSFSTFWISVPVQPVELRYGSRTQNHVCSVFCGLSSPEHWGDKKYIVQITVFDERNT
jgi:hypothetical protein